MTKPIQKYLFKCIEGEFVDVLGDSKTTLAQTLIHLNIIIDDKCEFARFRDYETMQYIIYRAYTQNITIEIWKIQD